MAPLYADGARGRRAELDAFRAEAEKLLGVSKKP
jgi:hypothetical protein